MSRAREAMAALAAYLAVFMGVFSGVVLLGRSFVHRDILSFYYPVWRYAVTTLKSGEFPLWNPFLSFGAPCFGNVQSCVLYPGSLLLYIGPFTWSFNFFIVAHLALASFGTYLWVRDQEVSWPAALLSGLMFGFGGYAMSAVCLTTSLCSAAYFPLALFAFRRALRGDGPVWKAAVPAVLLCQYLAGEPGILLMTVCVLAVAAMTESARRAAVRAPAALRPIGLWLYSVVVFLGLSAFQSFLFIELLMRSERAGLSVAEKLRWSFPPAQWLNTVIPSFSEAWFYGVDYWQKQSWMPNPYLGVTVMALACAAFARRKDRRVAVHGALLAGGALLAMGRYTPVYPFLFKWLPFLSFVRYPARFFFLFAFAAACLAGFGLDTLIKTRTENRRGQRGAVAILLAAALLSVALLASLRSPGVWRAAAEWFAARRGLPLTDADFTQAVLGVIVNARRSLFFFALTAAGMLSVLRSSIPRKWAVVFLAAVALADIGANARLETVPARELEASSPTIDAVKADRAFSRVMASPKLMQSATSGSGAGGPEGLAARRDRLTPNFPLLHGLHDAIGYDSVFMEETLRWRFALQEVDIRTQYGMPDALNVKYITSPNDEIGPGYELANRSPHVNLFKSKHVLPRAYMVRQAVPEKGVDAVVRRMGQPEYDAREQLFVGEPFSAQVRTAGENGADRADIVEYGPNRVKIKARVGGRPWLFLSDAHYPGWKALVDGKPQEILKADFAFRALALEPGEHAVEFRYDPPLFKFGIAVSLVTLLFVVTGVAFGLKRAGNRPA